MKKYAFFDFDGTLTRTDSVLPFLKFCCKNNLLFYIKLIPLLPTLVGYFAGLVSNASAKERVIDAYLHNWRVADVEAKAAEFAEHELPNLLFSEGMFQLSQHKAQGDICVLVSASPEWYLQHWGKQHGFDAIIATKMATLSGCLTGKIDGENCHDFAKVRRINALFGENCWQNSIAYSDSRVDLPMLQRASEGFLLNKQTKKFEKI